MGFVFILLFIILLLFINYNYSYHGIHFLYLVRFSLLHRTYDFTHNFALQFILTKAEM
jgi:hypothetical protein